MHRLSIIIPSYNAARTLVRTLDSIDSILMPGVEVIVVNDGSSDDTSAIAEGYRSVQHHDIRVVNQENRGLSCARNAGFSQARGEWVMFLDADDWLLKDGLAAVLEAMSSNSDVILFPFMLSNNKGYVHHSRTPIEETLSLCDVRVDARELRNLMLGAKCGCDSEVLNRVSYCNYNSSCSRIMRRSRLLDIFKGADRYGNPELFYESVSSMGEDRFFNIRLWTALSGEDVVLSPRTLYYYNVGDKCTPAHLSANILSHLCPRKEVIFTRMTDVCLSRSEAEALFAKDCWEYFFWTLRIRGEESKIVTDWWKTLARDDGLAAFFRVLPGQSVRMKMNCVVVGWLIRHGYVSLAAACERAAIGFMDAR